MVLLVLNVVIQALFTYIVRSALSSPAVDGDTVEGLRTWRKFVAHDLKFYNFRTKKTLG